MRIPTTALKLADHAAQGLGLLDRPFDLDTLIRLAHRRTGLTDFGDVAFTEPLGRFLESCATDASLSLFGKLATRWDVVRFLSNLLLLRAEELRNPAILAQPIEQPIFITGLPRSGTTFLHRMLLLDPANRGPLVYETIFPLSAPDSPHDSRPARVARQLRAFEFMAPEFHSLHPLEAVSPQECSEITAHVFRSLRFDTTYRVPSYRAWLEVEADGHLPAYRFHKRFLQHLQWQAPQGTKPPRWVVKCPDHLFALATIRTIYPNARMVFVHRDPVKVLLSVAKLTEVLRRPFTRRLDPAEIGRDESLRWQEGTRRMMAVGNDAGLPEPVCHVHYLDLVSDPVSTIEQVYGHFGLVLPAAARKAMEASVRANPNGGYGRHDYRFDDHGLNAEAEQQKFRSYLLRFGVTPETRAHQPSAAHSTPSPRPTRQDRSVCP